MLKRFKLYKSGKLWIRGLVLMTAVGFGTIIGFVNTTFADDSNNVGLNQDEIAQQSSTSISGVSTTKVKAEDDSNFNTSSNSLNAQATEKLTPDSVQSNQQNINKNGWQKNSEGQIIYYQNDKPLSGRQYSYLPTIPNTNVQGTNNWYLTDNGVVQAGFQAWAGSHYYFDPSTYLRVDNDYRTIGDGSTGYLLGSNGQALSGVQKWAGTYYYFDPTTYLKQNDVYATSQWGMKYMFGKDGRIVTGLYKWDKNGQVYYFDPTTYLAVTNNYILANDGHWYLFTADGTAASGVQKWAGTYYYFDPVTHLRVDDDYVTSQWGMKYMFGKDGRIVTGLYKWDKNGQVYYFDPTTYLAVTNKYMQANDGHWYLFTADGTAASGVQKLGDTYYYFDPQTHQRVDNNYVQSQWGDWYMFGPDGRIVTGEKEWYGHYYYFDPITYLKVTNKWVNGKYYKSDGTRAQNETISINGQNYSFDNNGDVVSNRASQVVAIARQQLDKPYVWGATGPNSFDCSGLVQYVYRQIGVNLPRTTYQQEYQGTAVSLNALQPGDLLFWGRYGSAYHVAIYIGNGDFIQAPQPGERVKITTMSYYHPDFARRIL
ncbi:NlpC/P60 family protein [Limosilactobacillus reuteri]|uniref:NlpC/P60 family protein n=1 Tax=Limosilactobacillus reuteri TaxID=1598 RepID=UPI0009BED877|nr:NlpC/P60 family protein [Limosilactobacillus reuteri]